MEVPPGKKNFTPRTRNAEGMKKYFFFFFLFTCKISLNKEKKKNLVIIIHCTIPLYCMLYVPLI